MLLSRHLVAVVGRQYRKFVSKTSSVLAGVQRDELRLIAGVAVGLSTAEASAVSWTEALYRHRGMIPASSSRSRAYRRQS